MHLLRAAWSQSSQPTHSSQKDIHPKDQKQLGQLEQLVSNNTINAKNRVAFLNNNYYLLVDSHGIGLHKISIS